MQGSANLPESGQYKTVVGQARLPADQPTLARLDQVRANNHSIGGSQRARNVSIGRREKEVQTLDE